MTEAIEYIEDFSDLTELFGGIQEKKRFNFKNGDGLGASAKPTDYIINGILERDSIGILAGSSQSLKSFLSLALAQSLCSGNDFFGRKVFGGKHKVMYICGEGAGGISRRIRALQQIGMDFNNNLIVLNDSSISIDNKTDMIELRTEIIDRQIALVIFDTLSSLSSKTNENDNSEVSAFLKMLQETVRTDFGTTGLIVHHYGKDKERGMRGASAFGNNVDFEFGMSRQSLETLETTLSCRKMKDGELFQDINFIGVPVALGFDEMDGSESTSLVLRHYDGKLAGVKPDQYTMIMIEYQSLLETDPRPTIMGNGVCKKVFYKNLAISTGIDGPILHNAIKRFKEKYGKENYNEINNIIVLTEKNLS